MRPVLNDGERVVFSSGMHWKNCLMPSGVLAVGILFLSVRLRFYGENLVVNWDYWLSGLVSRSTVSFVEAAVCVFLMLCAAKTLLDVVSTRYLVTNRRIVAQHGWLDTVVCDMAINRYETVTVHKPLLGRLLGYGDILLFSAGAQVFLNDVPHPERFRQEIDALRDGKMNNDIFYESEQSDYL